MRLSSANLADLELHTFLHRAPAIETPTTVAFDLDPGPPADIVLSCQVGLWLKELFAKFKLKSFPKTSGSKGLQVYVPLNTKTTYEKNGSFRSGVAESLEHEFPVSLFPRCRKVCAVAKFWWAGTRMIRTRPRLVFIRYVPKSVPPFPLRSPEVTTALKKKNAKLLTFEVNDVLKRVKKDGDLFAPVLTLKQKLPTINFYKITTPLKFFTCR